MNNKKYDSLAPSAKSREDWMNKKWRPMMGWMYMVVCITDFIIFPILWSYLQWKSGAGVGEIKKAWEPITLQGAGLFHVAMGVVLGLTTWGRTQEKINGIQAYTSMQPNGTTVMTTYGTHDPEERYRYESREYDEEVPRASKVRPPIVKPPGG